MEHEERVRLGATFDLDAAGYDAGRPDYPTEAWERVLAHLAIGQGDRVLEIGAGTGQATGRLLDTGATVHAIEPGPELADLLRGRHHGRALEVDTAMFETATLTGPYDAVAAATSFHWVDPDVGVPRIHDALRPGGRLALWWNVYRDPESPAPDPVDAVVRSTTRLPNMRGLNGILDELQLPDRLADAGFTDIERHVVRWSITHDESSLLALFASFSDMRKRKPDEREEVFAELRQLVRERGGSIERPATSPVLTATRATA